MSDVPSKGSEMTNFGPGARAGLHGVEVVVPYAPPPLGPGDDDPLSQTRGTAAEARGPLGPGDDDPTPIDRGTPLVSGPPPGPGDGPESEFDMAAPPPPGPGSVDYGPRRITVFAKKKPAPAVAEPNAESSPRRSRRP
jgi:hypothetical protein